MGADSRRWNRPCAPRINYWGLDCQNISGDLGSPITYFFQMEPRLLWTNRHEPRLHPEPSDAAILRSLPCDGQAGQLCWAVQQMRAASLRCPQGRAQVPAGSAVLQGEAGLARLRTSHAGAPPEAARNPGSLFGAGTRRVLSSPAPRNRSGRTRRSLPAASGPSRG